LWLNSVALDPALTKINLALSAAHSIND